MAGEAIALIPSFIDIHLAGHRSQMPNLKQISCRSAPISEYSLSCIKVYETLQADVTSCQS